MSKQIDLRSHYSEMLASLPGFSDETSAVGEATWLQISRPSALYKKLSARAKEAKGEETDIEVMPGNQGTGVVSPCLATRS